MPRPLSLAEHTLLAELVDQTLDGMFDDQFPENGSFVTRSIKARDGTLRDFLYYQGYRPKSGTDGKAVRYSKYVGPADDQKIVDRVNRFAEIKARRAQSGNLVNALAGAGLPRPQVMMGRILEALAKAGVFRLRAVLVGTAAYQTYPAVTGMRLNETAAITGDIDIAQFRSISIGVEDKTTPILETLRAIDPTFSPVPHINDPIRSSVFANASGFRLDILTAHRGSDDQMDRPMDMPIDMAALTGAAAQPLRFRPLHLLDYLIRDPVRSVVLFGPGISVNVPTPGRFAIHKLIISGERQTDAVGMAKSRKDILQASEIILALSQASNAAAIRQALDEAWERGPRWRDGITTGAKALAPEARKTLAAVSEGKINDDGEAPLTPRPQKRIRDGHTR